MADTKLILAGDIGGTKTNLALFSVQEGKKLHPEAKKSFPSKNYPGLEPVLEEFLRGFGGSIDRACFGVAGPVADGKVKTPNLPWMLDSTKLAASLKLPSVSIINDLEATAYGIFTLGREEFFDLNEGKPPRVGNRALIAAGTGLGQAIIYDDGEDFYPMASEGGHADFAPRNDLEIELLRYLIDIFGHVSYERVVSGPGLVNIYNFLKQSGRLSEPSWLTDQIASGHDAGAVISQAALAGEAEICVKALDLFASVYGAEAGNLALKGKSVRGLYIGGGIAPKILKKLKDGTFMRAFVDKGRFSEFLSAVPVRVILNDRAALRGAAYYAAFRSHGK